MRFPAQTLSSALNQFYESASLHKIQRQLKLDFGSTVNPATIYRWISRYTKKAVDLTEDVSVRVGHIWIADETVLNLKSGRRKTRRGKALKEPPGEIPGERVWLWDIIDEKTRFLLATHVSPTRTSRDAQALMTRAARRTRRAPQVIITDKLSSYLEGIDQVFGDISRHWQSGPFELGVSTASIERLHGTIKDRTKVLRSLATRESARLFMAGWATHYNFFRPHSGLQGRTPAEAAGARTRVKSWADVVGAGG